MAIRAYLDGSGKPHEKRLTLAAFAAQDGIWAQMENDWRAVLNAHPLRPQYIHMKELCPLKGEFSRDKGWTQEASFGLLNQMLMFLQVFDKQEFQMYYCTIDLEARRKLIVEGYTIPSAVDICNQYCSEVVLKAHMKMTLDRNPDAREAEEMVFVFDNGEDFFHPFCKKWEREVKRFRKDKGWNPWNIITDVHTTTRMKDLPGLQAVDVLAWCVNREHTVEEGTAGKMHAHILRQIVSQYYIVFDEDMLRQKYGRVKLR
ncbi:MAG TPA: DUF3800 domain-containing protein [Acidobacteriaceae bacterium]|nr:DUF3800 domain-containing protein [Acidobacteriaceae bacterium]